MRKRSQSKSSTAGVSIKEFLSQKELEDLKSTFDLFDEAATGLVNPFQIQTIFRQLGLDKRNASLAQMIEDFDAKGQHLNFDDFLQAIYGRLGNIKTKEGLLKIFNIYDYEKVGSINFQKIQKICMELGQTMGEVQIQQMIHSCHVLNQTADNIEFSFQQFYQIVTRKQY